MRRSSAKKEVIISLLKSPITWVIFIALTITGIIIAKNKNRQRKARKTAEDISDALSAELNTDKDFAGDAQTLKEYMGISDGFFDFWTQTFNGKDEEIVLLLQEYDSREFHGLSETYKVMFKRNLLNDLSRSLSPFEFNKLRNIFP